MPKTITKPLPKRAERTRGGANKPAAATRLLTPSPALAAIVGAAPLPRTQATARLWAYIREHDRQDPADRRAIVADDALRPIIGGRCSMFDLPGLLGSHLAAA